VEYDPSWRTGVAEKGLISFAARREGRVENDNRADWTEAWQLFPGDVVYCWHAGRRASEVQTSLELAGFEIRNQIIWAKQNFAISRGNYHWQHEPCWYAIRKGKNSHWIGDRSNTTLWNVRWDRNIEGGHGTQKPIELMVRSIRNHDGNVYDPFLGSGTTFVACQNLNRRGYGIEILPAYVAVCLERMNQTFPGIEIKRL
jgi:DNA modification methylase